MIHNITEKLTAVVDQVAQQHNLEQSVVLKRLPPIDIFVFGRSGIGKSTLIEAITNEKVPSSAQLDHVTTKLTEINKTMGTLKFRFWDTKGIDNWRDSDGHNLIIEMKERDIKPIFIIYCAAAGGRVDSEIVTGILRYFVSENIPICYVITNIYASSVEQYLGQVEGGRSIMYNVFHTNGRETGKYCFEYDYISDKRLGSAIQNKGIFIGVNSCTFTNIAGTHMELCNIHELMDFIARNLNDEEFTQFVALTINNRGFWNRAYDTFRSRLLRIKEKIIQWNILPTISIESFFIND